jgi:hypothetical protein
MSFFDFERWYMHVDWMEARYMGLECSLSSLVSWCTCDSGSNILKWPGLFGMK